MVQVLLSSIQHALPPQSEAQRLRCDLTSQALSYIPRKQELQLLFSCSQLVCHVSEIKHFPYLKAQSEAAINSNQPSTVLHLEAHLSAEG